MKPASITKVTVYRVEQEIPDRVYTLYNDNREYESELCECTRDALKAGGDHYATSYEWAEYATHSDATICASKFAEFVARWEAKAKEFDAEEG